MSETTTPTVSPDGVLTRPLAGSGEGMDRRKTPRRFPPRRIAMIVGAAALIALLLYVFQFQDRSRRYATDRDRLTISTVQHGDFQEYIAVTGTAQPIRTIYLDAVVGGQVQQRFVEEGAIVQAGDPILQLGNDQLTLQTLSSEAQLSEQISTLRTTRLALDQNQLSLSQQLTELDYNITRLQHDFERQEDLVADGFAPAQDLQRTRDELTYLRRRRDLTLQSHRADSLSRAVQLRQMDATLSRLQRNLALVQATMQNLIVTAPVTGQLTALNAEVGEAKTAGTRLGQIDVLDGYKVQVPVDEHYIARVAPGQRGTATVAGEEYVLEVSKVYPEVANGRFQVDMTFLGPAPADLRRGQSLRIRLELGDPEQALLLARGGFFQSTGGSEAFVLSEDGQTAALRPIQLARQNPQFFEVTEGLRPGDQVVTSSYETFGDAETLVLR